MKISRKLFSNQKSHSLESIIKRHGLKVSDRHRAYADARAMIDFLHVAEKELSSAVVLETINVCLESHTLPSTIDPEIIKNLPHAPGVYFFYDNEDSLLYIGKSVDIKNRVKSHFSQDYVSAKERILTDKVSYIDFEVTSGELSALLRESALIKEFKPPYNRRLRASSSLAVLKSTLNAFGYKTSTVFYRNKMDITELSDIEGVFRTLRSAKAVMRNAIVEYQLCPKLIGLESGKGPCFNYQLGVCSGACINKESAEMYNKRFMQAFEKMKIRAWPYKGPITLPEDPHSEEGSAYLVDKWKILKKYTYTQEGYSEDDIDQPFDFDTYRILSKHILKLM